MNRDAISAQVYTLLSHGYQIGIVALTGISDKSNFINIDAKGSHQYSPLSDWNGRLVIQFDAVSGRGVQLAGLSNLAFKIRMGSTGTSPR